MRTSQKGVALINSFEGLRLTAYQDFVGVWTIGYGSTRGVTAGMKVTVDQAEGMLQADIARFGAELEKLIGAAEPGAVGCLDEFHLQPGGRESGVFNAAESAQ